MTANQKIEETFKEPSDELYQAVLPVSETGEILLLRSSDYMVLVSIGQTSLRMHSVSSVFDIGAGPDLVQAGILDPAWLDSFHARGMPEIRSTPTKR